MYSKDLHDQLTTRPETRFLAAYLFGRFLWTVSAGENNITIASSASSRSALRQAELDEGERRLVFDLAVAAIALGVKVRSRLRPAFYNL